MLKFIKYNIVGVINTLFTLTIIYILQQIFFLKPIISNFSGYVCGVVLSYTLNSIWTFKKTDDRVIRAIKFLIVFLIAYSVNLLALEFFLNIFINLNKFVPQILAAVFYSIIGFTLNKNFVFS